MIGVCLRLRISVTTGTEVEKADVYHDVSKIAGEWISQFGTERSKIPRRSEMQERRFTQTRRHLMFSHWTLNIFMFSLYFIPAEFPNISRIPLKGKRKKEKRKFE